MLSQDEAMRGMARSFCWRMSACDENMRVSPLGAGAAERKLAVEGQPVACVAPNRHMLAHRSHDVTGLVVNKTAKTRRIGPDGRPCVWFARWKFRVINHHLRFACLRMTRLADDWSLLLYQEVYHQ
jgi:hypothetical protein